MAPETIEEIEEDIPADIIEKEFKDLSDSEKVKISRELKKFEVSDFWTNLQSKLEEESKGFEDCIEKELSERKTGTEPVMSQFDRDIMTHSCMVGTVKELTDESIGAKIFQKNLETGAKNYRKQAMERIEAGYDAPMYSQVDVYKHKRALCLSVKVWLDQTKKHFEKVEAIEELPSAYDKK